MTRKRDGFTNNIGTILNDTVDQVVCDAISQNYAHKTTKKLLCDLIKRCNLGQEDHEDSSDSKYVCLSNSDSNDSSISTFPGSVSGTSMVVDADETKPHIATADVTTVDIVTSDMATTDISTTEDSTAGDDATADVATADVATKHTIAKEEKE